MIQEILRVDAARETQQQEMVDIIKARAVSDIESGKKNTSIWFGELIDLGDISGMEWHPETLDCLEANRSNELSVSVHILKGLTVSRAERSIPNWVGLAYSQRRYLDRYQQDLKETHIYGKTN